jgi:hypothetical protein
MCVRVFFGGWGWGELDKLKHTVSYYVDPKTCYIRKEPSS